MRNFGRSLLAGYCPTYMPDLALHGTGSDERLKQCLTADLLHTVRVSDPRRGPPAADRAPAGALASHRCPDRLSLERAWRGGSLQRCGQGCGNEQELSETP